MAYTFTAAVKRDDQPVKEVANCTTYEGYLCKYFRRVYQPLWNSESLAAAGISHDLVKPIATIQAAIASPYAAHLFKFGKQEGYWVWNVEAAEKKKVAAAKMVYLYEPKQQDWDDDEQPLRVSDKPYPAEVWEAIMPNVEVIPFRNGGKIYEVTNYTGLVSALKDLGWKTNK